MALFKNKFDSSACKNLTGHHWFKMREPKPKFKWGDVVTIGKGEYRVEVDVGYDPYLKDRRYKVRPVGGGV